MKRSRRILSLLLPLCLLFGFAACSSETSTTTESSTADASVQDTTTAQKTETTAATQSDAQADVLVVYYSATGNTEAAAEYIAEATGGDLFALEPVTPYSDADLDWTDDNSRVSQEYENESQRDVALTQTTVENWTEYDTVYIGYPIWWGIAAWPVNGFVKANDFTGKTVIPFCTSASSGLGESDTLLAELAGTGEWLDGQRFSSGVSEAEVQTWLDGIA